MWLKILTFEAFFVKVMKKYLRIISSRNMPGELREGREGLIVLEALSNITKKTPR